MNYNMNTANKIEKNTSFFSAQYMPRPRIDKIFDQAAGNKLIYVIAGAGYGKTLAVRNYVYQYPDALVRWLQFTESDNIGSYYWEHLTQNIFSDNPALTAKLRELGFPETVVRFKQFADILKTTEYQAYKTFIILDDFHLINSKQVLTFVERYIRLQLPGVCVIVVSRKEPEINIVSLLSKGRASIIAEEDLLFTEDEIAEFLKFRGIPFLTKNLPILSEATKGWAIAIQLFSLVMKKTPENFDLALNTMKQNIFKLMETEAFDDFPENIKKITVKSALLSDLPVAPLNIFSGDDLHIQNILGLTSFIWFDSMAGDYKIHPLYLEFLESKQALLSSEEKLETYRKAAQWCSENSFYMDAMKYYAKSRQYDLMIKVLLSYPFKLPRDTCEYFLNILEGLESDGESSNRSFLLLKNFFIPILLLGTGRYEEARTWTLDVIREWEQSDNQFALNLLYASYSNLAYIDIYTCTVTHKYNAPEYLKKSVEYLKMAEIPPVKVAGPFAVADIRSFACLVGEGAELEDFDKFLEAARQTAFYVEETFHDMYYGYEDLVACEIDFHKNKLDWAKKYARSAFLKAHEKKQYSIEIVAVHYLLRIAMHEGDYPHTRNLLKQLRGYLDNSDFWSRQLLYDLIIGDFYAQIGLPDRSPLWLTIDEKEENSEVRLPLRELIVSAKNYIALKKYDLALTVLNNSCPTEPYERFVFGELTLSLLTAAAKIKIGDVQGALENFKRAYSLSMNGVFETPFIEQGKNLRPLISAALKRADCGIPAAWLNTIDRKANIYAKKIAVIRDSYKREKNIPNTIRLSEREREILNDLYYGLTREEISVDRYLSLPTVKKIIESVYIKLDANNVADAIRIALKNKLIDE